MRVLIVTNLYPPQVLGGYEILCRDVAEALATLGHDVRVLTADAAAIATADATDTDGKVSVERTLRLYPAIGQPVRTTLLGRLRHTRDNAAVVRRYLQAWQPDVVFAWNQNRLSLGPLYEAANAGLPIAYTHNDPHIRQFAPTAAPGIRGIMKRMVERWIEPRLTWEGLAIDAPIAISDALRSQLQELGWPGANQTRVVHQGIPLDRFPCKPQPGEIAGTVPTVLYAGTLSPDKGVDTLLEAARILHRQGTRYRLTLLGGGAAPDVHRYRAFVDWHGLQETVQFAGRCERSQIPAAMRTHDLLVFPSEWPEPFGLSHLEAMASGPPVV